MKLFLEYDPKNKSGKGKFLSRLTPELVKLGVRVQYKPKGADITLGITRFRGEVTKKKVLRIDGIHFIDSKKHKWNNRRIRKAIKSADAVIYQSKWGKFMINNMLKVDPKCYCIYNGANPDDYKDPIKSGYPKNVLMASKWKASDDRRQKRLEDMYKIAREYAKKNEDVCFWIAGAHNHTDYGIKQIRWLGYLEERILRRYYAMADVFLHLGHWCWCDNALVEAVCAGCLPIASDKTGSGEMLKLSGGMPVNIDEEIKPKANHKDNKPPPFDYDPVYTALDRAFQFWTAPDYTEFHIKEIARQYYNVFKEVLK